MTNYEKGYKQGKRDAIDGVPAHVHFSVASRTFRDGYYDGYDQHERKRK